MFASGEVWESKFPFQTKKRKESEQEEKKTARQERFGADRQGVGDGGVAREARRCESRTFVFTFSQGSLEPNQTSLCQRTTLAHSWLLTSLRQGRSAAALRNNILLSERKKKKKRRGTRLIAPFIRGEGGLRSASLFPRRCQTPRFLRDGNREKDLKWPGGRGGISGAAGTLTPGPQMWGRGARIGPRPLPSAGPY